MSTTTESRVGERAATRRTSPSDAGFSFVEIVVTIVLLGIIVVPIMAAVRATVRASSVSGEAARVETAIINAADRINRAPMSCDYTMYAQASVQTAGWEALQASVSMRHYDLQSGALAPESDGGCVPGTFVPSDGLVQLVTITIVSPQHQIERHIQVVKSDAV
jgi:prepilin-type N-terminal cleavage/methylation domain-containing protein